MEIVKSRTFDRWLSALVDARARARIQVRIDRLHTGNAGDSRPVGDGISEMRIDYGPGYRVYFLRRGARLIVLLCGGDKSTQTKDIASAKAIAAEWKDHLKTFTRYDAADYLKTAEDICAYLEASAEENDPAQITLALGAVARARNISQVARDAGLTREGLYKALSAEGNPSFATITKVARALGLQVTFKALAE